MTSPVRRLAWWAIPFGAGVALAQLVLPEELWLPAGLLCALCALSAAFVRGGKRLRLLLLTLGAAAGLIWSHSYRLLVYAPAEAMVGREVAFTAQVADYPVEAAYGVRVAVRLEEGGVLALYYGGEECGSLRPGDVISGTARVRSARQSHGQEVTWYTAKGIFLLAYGEGEAAVTRPDRMPLNCWPAELAHRLGQAVEKLLASREAGFIRALLTGNREGLTDTFTTSLSRSGLSHMVAVSGMHVTFLSGMLMLLVGRRRLGAALCIPILVFFVGVAGATPSVTRSVIMQTILLMAPLLRRENDPPTSLSAALMVLLLVNPYAAASISLQLSFASVAGILLWTERLYAWMCAGLTRGREGAKLPGPLAAICSGVATTLGALPLTLPLTAWHFNTISLIAPLSNLLVLWAVGLLFGLGMVLAVLGLIAPPLAGLLAGPVTWLTRYVMEVTDWLGGLPLAAVTVSSLYLKLWLAYLCAVVLLLAASRGLRRRWWIPAAGLALTFCLCLLLHRSAASAGGLNVDVLDVGQGQCILLRTSEGKTVAVDCGGSSLDSAGDILADRLQELGHSRLDLLVLTHFHSDHTNGLEALFHRVTVEAMAVPCVRDEEGAAWRERVLALAGEQGTRVRWVEADETLTWPSLTLRLYAPLGAGEQNEEGLSVLATCGTSDLLITGDMTEEIERRLVRYGDLPDVEVLVAGHHGSPYATSQLLLDAARPEAAVISVGWNSYGHPAAEVLDRLEAMGIQIWRTDLDGTVSIQMGIGE